jgi:CheY-like chemotaxis protein/MinD-like ATPase involved in chromosome partitioning or flagellar assembly
MPRALVIDDEAEMTAIIARFLESGGFGVETATSGREGIATAIETSPDAVVLDVMMPEMDGYEVCRRLRRDPRTARTAIVILTARGQLIDRESALRAGADAHVSKPFQGKALVEQIRQLVGERQEPVMPLGYQVLVLRLSPGAGATTVATNLGLALSRPRAELAIVADMALRQGQVAGRLGLAPGDRWPEPFGDAGDLAAHVVRHESGLFVLPALPAGRPLPPPAGIKEGLRLLREWHDYVVVDTPFNLGPLAPVLLASSPLVLMLLRPDPSVLNTARASLGAIKRMGNRTTQVWPILNMIRPGQEGFLAQIEKTLGHRVASILPWAPRECARAVDLGKPVIQSQPDSALGRAFQDLARRVRHALDDQPVGRTTP